MIAVIDYGTGNLASVVKGLRAAGGDARIARAPDDLDRAAGIVIPGVGHFDAARPLTSTWRPVIETRLARGIPLLGICLGMQWLYAGSDEAPGIPGLGIFEARIGRLTGGVKLPHVGWNGLNQLRESPLMNGVKNGDAAYFTHSYAAPVDAATVADTDHGIPFASIVERGRVTGMQFHPEKSGRVGIVLLANWLKRCSASA